MSAEACFPRGGTEQTGKKITYDEDGEVALAKSMSGGKGDSATKSKLTKGKAKIQSHPAGKVGKAKSFKNKTQSGKQKLIKGVEEALEKMDDSTVTFVPERLSTKKVIKGTMLLGAVKDIRDYEIRVNLPNNLLGSVSITNMADGYTGLLKKFAQSTDDQSVREELCSLNELFTVGQILPCVCIDEATDSQLIQLSINPKVLHEHLSPQCLHRNMVLYGSVSGIEDHGCQIDIGVPNITAFMSTPIKTDLSVGMTRRFRVTESDVISLISGDSRTVNVALQTEEDKNEATSDKELQFNSILPGMLFEGKVYSRKTEGLVIRAGRLRGYAHVSHLSQHVKDYPTEQKIKFRVLSVNTSTKYIHLTGLPSLLTDIDKPGDGAVNIPLGEPITATLSRVVDKYAFVSTSEGHVTYMGVSLLPEKLRDCAKQNEVKVKCFWFGWDYLERRPVFSTTQPNVKKSVIPTLVPGDRIDAKILRITAVGAKAKLASGLHVFIPNIHLTEVPLKNPEKKLIIGQKLPCKILSVNQSTKRVRLTAKPSLVSSTLPVLSDLGSANVGSFVQGVIVKLTTGALVSFYNDVVGFVSSVNLAKEPILQPANVFYIGQSVMCRILSCNAEKDKLALTFVLDDDVPSRKKYAVTEVKRSKEELPKGPKMDIGEVVELWTVLSLGTKGYNVLSVKGHRAILPFAELSDMPGIADIVSSSVQPEVELKDLVCISNNSFPYIVSNKLMFKYYSARDGLAKDWENVQVDRKYPASILSHTEHGIFSSFGNGLVGLTPKRMLPSNYKKYLLPGKSVLAKIISIDKDKERMIVALREPECSVPDANSDLIYKMLAQNLMDVSMYQKWAAQNAEQAPVAAQISGYNVGDVVKGTITKREDDLVELKLEDGTSAIAAGDSMTGCLGGVGEAIMAVVMHVDLLNGTLDVILEKRYVLDRKSIKSQSISSQVKVGQRIKCEIVYTRPEYIVAMLKGHANGRLAYLPTVKHPNGICSSVGVFYGQENKVTIKQCDMESTFIIASLQSERDKQQSKAEEIQNASNLPATGSVVEAVISGKQELQLNLEIGKKAIGRVFISEVDDAPKPGTNPLHKFKTGAKIKVIVIGVKMIVTTKKLKTIKDDGQRVMLECSLKQCQKENWEPEAVDLVIGKQYTCYVTQHSIGRSNVQREKNLLDVVTSGGGRAVISWFDLGETISSVADMVAKFPIGTCLQAKLMSINSGGEGHMAVVEAVDDSAEDTDTDHYPGMIVEYKPESGLIVSTSISPKARIPLSEMSEPGVDLNLTKFQNGLVVNCRLVKKTRHGGVIMSLRQTAGLLQLEELKENMVLPAIVSIILPTSVSVMAAGHVINVTMKPAQHKKFAKTNRGGSACWIRVTSAKNRKIEAVFCEKEELPNTKSTEEAPLLSPVSPVKRKCDASDRGGIAEPSYKEPRVTRSTNCKATAMSSSHISKRKDPVSSFPQNEQDVEEEIVDGDTGVHIVFKRQRNESQRPMLDFGTCIQTLQKEPALGGNTLESTLDQLENAGKLLRKVKPAIGESDVLPRKVKLAATQGEGDRDQPQSEAEYLLLLKSSPNSGKIWSKLISFTAEHKGVEAARARAEQALETVSYRLENEKMTVWTAFLRLEIVYGTEDTLDNVKRRAMQQMNELKLYQVLVRLHLAQDNVQEAEQCYTMMLRRWSDHPSVWIDYGNFFFDHQKLESARTLLQRALKILPVKNHIEVIMKFAQMEMKNGQFDRFTSLFENILSNFPKRTDVWSVYVDQLTKSEHYELARSVLRRAVMQKWNSKTVQFFIKKFTEFETLHGTEDSLKEANNLIKTI